MNLDDEVRMWLEKRKSIVVKKMDDLQGELDFINDRLDGTLTKKLPRQYFHIGESPIYTHGSELKPPYYKYMDEYQQFLKDNQDLI